MFVGLAMVLGLKPVLKESMGCGKRLSIFQRLSVMHMMFEEMSMEKAVLLLTL